MHKLLLVFVVLFVSSCASFPPEIGSVDKEVDKKLDLPDDLAAEFKVEEAASEAGQKAIQQKTIQQKAKTTSKKAKAKKQTKKISKAQAVEAQAKEAKQSSDSLDRSEKYRVPWKTGETIRMDVHYIGMTAGTIEMKVLSNKVVRGREVYHLQGRGTSASVFSWFYRVDDIAETFVDKKGLFSHKFVFKANESQQTRDLLELYDYENKVVHYWHKHDHFKKGFKITRHTNEIPIFAQDALSAGYFLRTMPLKTGDVYRFPIVSNGKPWELEATVLRREDIYTRMGTKKAIVVRPVTKFEGVAKESGESLIWISDDEDRYFLQLQANVKVGSITAKVKEISYDDKAK